jgi:PRTRC genetic system ThiF family protein
MWVIPAKLLGAQPLSVALVGVGGTGSEMASNLVHLHHALRALGLGGLDVTLFDPDLVSEANVVRQRYHASDIGRFKCEVLAHRVNLSCGFGWQAVPERFAGTYARRGWDLVISCVDTRQARRQLHQAAFADRFSPWKLWLDCGNDATIGQVILGTPRPKKKPLAHALPCATELHPELMDVTRPDDETPSCSAIEALTKQDLMVNKMVATLATDLLWRLFHDGQIADHGRYFDLRRCTLAALAVLPKPARTRKKFGVAGREAGDLQHATRRNDSPSSICDERSCAHTRPLGRVIHAVRSPT